MRRNYCWEDVVPIEQGLSAFPFGAVILLIPTFAILVKWPNDPPFAHKMSPLEAEIFSSNELYCAATIVGWM